MADGTDAQYLKATPGNIPNDGIIFVDHSKNHRGGHLGHALVQCANGDVLAFYPNCGAEFMGHSGNGWMEYKRSADGGETWQEAKKLDYSYNLYSSGCGRTAMAEKAVCCDDGTVLLFLLICDMTSKPLKSGDIKCWEPYFTPVVLKSTDNGETFSEAGKLTDKRGRVYDALYRDGKVFVMFFANDAVIHYTGNLPEHEYELYVSENSGKDFHLESVLSIDPTGRCYGTMEFLKDGRLMAVAYNSEDEYHPDYCVSEDMGKTWNEPGKLFMAKRLRNPQLVRFGNGYYIHGRSGNFGDKTLMGHFVIYYSEDAIHWDEGHYMQMRGTGAGAYSNNIVIKMPGTDKERLYIHSSHAYEQYLTNIVSFWIDK